MVTRFCFSYANRHNLKFGSVSYFCKTFIRRAMIVRNDKIDTAQPSCHQFASNSWWLNDDES